MAENIRIIKKYQNRKLYDTQDSCYVTLDGIAKMIREGEEIAVVDNNTKDDVTALILTQVLYEQEKTNQSVLPVSILKHIVRSGSNNLFEFMQKYIFGAVDAHTKIQEDLRLHVERLSKKGELSTEESSSLLKQISALQEAHKGQLEKRIDERLNQKAAAPTMNTTTANTTPNVVPGPGTRTATVESSISS